MRIDFIPPKTCKLFMRDNAQMRVLMGPVGSGKSVASCFEVVRRACQQEPGPDGIRRTRFAIVRETVRQLRDTTLKTFLDWFPPGHFGEFKKTSYTYEFKMGDVECEIMFRALDRPDDIANLNSLELTGAWFNECRDIRPEIVDAMSKRVGRYPSRKGIPTDKKWPTWYGMWGDTNPPVIGTWWYYQMEGIDPEDGVGENDNGWRVYKQPSGRGEHAENIENLPHDYYSTRGRSKEYIRVFIDGEYGHSPAGNPVYQYFKTDYHVAKEPLAFIKSPSHPIIVGMDLGLTPAAVICQQDTMGRVLVLDELVSKDMAAQRFVSQLLKPLLTTRYQGMPVMVIVDPAGIQRVQTDEATVVDIIRKQGLKVRKASTNKVSARINAVDDVLMKQIEGDPAFLVSPRCLNLKAAMMGGYRYHEKKAEIVKDKHSHIAEALQYAMLDISTVNGGYITNQVRPVEVSNSAAWT